VLVEAATMSPEKPKSKLRTISYTTSVNASVRSVKSSKPNSKIVSRRRRLNRRKTQRRLQMTLLSRVHPRMKMAVYILPDLP
jgi:hypothetical protein